MDGMKGDESWFFLHYPHDSIWAGYRDELLVQINPEIEVEKCLISVIWSVNGIDSLVDISKGELYNSAFFRDVVVPSLIDNICLRSRRKKRKVSMSIWTMHVLTIPASPLIVFRPRKLG
jgi:hypothetical protein